MSFAKKCDSCGKVYDLDPANILATVRFGMGDKTEIFELCTECFMKCRSMLPKECITSDQIEALTQLFKSLTTTQPSPTCTPCSSDLNSQLFGRIYNKI